MRVRPEGVRHRDVPHKQGRTIARRRIALAMGQGRSFEIGSQIFSGFVQAKTAARYFPGEFVNIVDIVGFSPESVPTSCNMQANCWGY